MGTALTVATVITLLTLVAFIELNYPGGSAGLLSQIQ